MKLTTILADLDFLTDLPPVSLIRGNLSDAEKEDLLRIIIDDCSVYSEDILNIEKLTTDIVKEVEVFSDRRPFGPVKLIVIEMSSASIRNQNSLLTLLENASDVLKFVLFSGLEDVIDTLYSRATIFTLGTEYSCSLADKNLVLEALSACKHHNGEKLEIVLRKWSEGSHAALFQWALETRSGRFRCFTMEETIGMEMPLNFPDVLIEEFSALRSARQKLSAGHILKFLIGEL